MKNSDAEILNANMEIVAGNMTVTAACEGLGISRTTFYRRLEGLEKKNKKELKTIENVTITIERLDRAAKEILDTLEKMLKTGKGYDIEKHDALDVVRTTIMLITGYRSALQKATMIFDNRQVNINVQPTDAQWEMMWREFVDPALRRAGVDKDKILRTAEIIEAEWETKD